MRVSVSLCTAIVLAMTASTASAMDANEIFSRLKAQADATTTVQGAGGVRRGLAVSYGDEPEAPAAAAPAPTRSVVAVPAAAPAAAKPAPAAPSYVAVQPSAPATRVQPTFAAQTPAAAPTPTYTLVEPAAPAASVTVAAPSYTPAATPSFQPAPAYAQIPTYTPVETPRATPVAARPTAASYSSVDQEQRIDLRIYFEWNSASLKTEAIGQLAELCTAIRRVGASAENRFKIIGHTDKSGSDDYNLYLSNARAREVKRHLVEECALPSEALLAVGEGERQSSPSTPSNAPEERRVEIQFVS